MQEQVVTLRATDDLDIEQLAQEATRSVGKAKQLLNDPLLSEKLSAEQLVRIAISSETQCTAGFIILHQKRFYEKLSGKDLMRIGISHFNFSELVIKQSELLEKLSSEEITLLGKRQNLAAVATVKNASRYGRLSKGQILELTMVHSAAAREVLNNPELTKYFTAEDLSVLIRKYPDFSQLASDNPVIKMKFNQSNGEYDVKYEDIFISQRRASSGATEPQGEESGMKSFFSKLSLSFSRLWYNEKDVEEEPPLSEETNSPDSKKGV